jgi:hypothetical protein
MIFRFNFRAHFDNECFDVPQNRESKRGFVKISAPTIEEADDKFFNLAYKRLHPKEQMALIQIDTTSVSVISYSRS